jgi:hypothetical protein
MELKAMSDLSNNNLANNRILDDWLLLALEEGFPAEVEQSSLDQLLFWWLGFDDRDRYFSESKEARPKECRVTIPEEDAKRSRARRLLNLALQSSEANDSADETGNRPQSE